MVRRIDDSRQADLVLPERPMVYAPPVSWKTPESLPELDGIVALDFETKDPGLIRGEGSSWPVRGEGFICGAAVACRDQRLYLPINHAAGNMDPMLFWTWLRKHAAKPSVTFVMANSIYDSGWLKRHGIVPYNAPACVQAMAYLLDENRFSLSLNALSREFLGRTKSTGDLKQRSRQYNVLDPMSNMDKLPAWDVAPYAVDDADLTLALYHKLMPLMERDELIEVMDLERASAQVAVDMRWLGVRIDLQRANELKTFFVDQRAVALGIIKDKTGVLMEPFENEAAAKALRAENSRVDFGTTALGKESVRKEILEQIDSPVSRAILNARKFDKLVGTFIDGYLMRFEKAGRIHAEFHPTRKSDNDSEAADDWGNGTTSGRFACSNPNLQNIPTRTEEGRLIRECFLPEEGEQWCKLDWASQEPRLTLHLAHVARRKGRRLRGAAEMVQRFIDNPLTDLHGECAALMNAGRSPAKIINLAIAYGQQGAATCRALGLPTKWIKSRRTGQMIEVAGDEGAALLRRHAEAVPYIKEIFDLAKETAETRKFIMTMSGRRIHFRPYGDTTWGVVRAHKALNAAVQGNAADQMKYALKAMREARIPVLVTVHDEAGISLPPGEEGSQRLRRAKEIMETVLPISVPMVAEHKIGANWGDAK